MALAGNYLDLAARALGNLGGCQYALHQYQPALKSFLEARRLAIQSGDSSAAAAIGANIASLYSEMGELDAAAEWLRQSLKGIAGRDRAKHLPKVLIQLATLRARQGRMEEALDSFRQGIWGADQVGDDDTYAVGWNRLGEEYLIAGDLHNTDRALLEAFRVRKARGLALDSSYRNLGRLRLAQGDLESAAALLDRAVELAAHPSGAVPAWDVYQARGLVRLAQGRLREALGDLGVALRLARAWRGSVPGDDSARVGAEGLVQAVYSAYIEAGNRLYLETHEPGLIADTFEAAEENRATSLAALVSGPQAAVNLPAEYWEALARLQRAEVQALREPGADSGRQVAGARAELIRMEAGAGLPSATPAPDLLARARAALEPGTALLSFQLGDSVSWRWALDREGLALSALPPRKEIARQADAAIRALSDDLPQANEAGAALYRALFGGLGSRIENQPRWLLALDEFLFRVPAAALVERNGPQPVYLVQRRTTQVIPSAGIWVESAGRRSAARSAGAFLGVGDPIYNSADSRLSRPAAASSWGSFLPLRLLASSHAAGPAPLALARLVASGPEIDACSREWGGERILLEGAKATRQELLAALRRKPSVVHLATHVLQSKQGPGYGMIALSLSDRGEPELLTPYEIGRWRADADLVVLSGCSSAEGGVLPATGALGLTRAWLAAGARAVVGSRWTVPDEDGAMFRSLYRNLKAQDRSNAAAALRQAQLEMIRSGGAHARPRYWGAFFVVGNS